MMPIDTDLEASYSNAKRATYTAPGCLPLPASLVTDPNGDPRVITRWHPDERERAAIAAGGDVWVSLKGRSPQPILVGDRQTVVGAE